MTNLRSLWASTPVTILRKRPENPASWRVMTLAERQETLKHWKNFCDRSNPSSLNFCHLENFHGSPVCPTKKKDKRKSNKFGLALQAMLSSCGYVVTVSIVGCLALFKKLKLNIKSLFFTDTPQKDNSPNFRDLTKKFLCFHVELRWHSSFFTSLTFLLASLVGIEVRSRS